MTKKVSDFPKFFEVVLQLEHIERDMRKRVETEPVEGILWKTLPNDVFNEFTEVISSVDGITEIFENAVFPKSLFVSISDCLSEYFKKNNISPDIRISVMDYVIRELKSVSKITVTRAFMLGMIFAREQGASK